MKADILIFTTTDIETRFVIDIFTEATGFKEKSTTINDRTYIDLGEVGGSRVFVGLTQMGTGGLGGSQESVRKGINALSPTAVIMSGIAFGMNSSKQKIGDVLVSERIHLYEHQRIGTGNDNETSVIPRGDRIRASDRLINRFRIASLRWSGRKFDVNFGLILSGNKLIDSVDFREHLGSIEPEAIGGEMEGEGLYVACHSAAVDWIIVKGICDWADGQKEDNKTENQTRAAKNAAMLVLRAIEEGPFVVHPVDSRIEKPTGEAKNFIHGTAYSSLPSQPYFFGREGELDLISDAISPDARTWGALIDGPGGIGKTALAIRAGHLASDEVFDRKLFISAKVRELWPSGEFPLNNLAATDFLAIVNEIARGIGQGEITALDPLERVNALRDALGGMRVLLIIDNVEAMQETERIKLYQLLSRLPLSCKAIVTSRRRTDIDARVVRLDRLKREEALNLLEELAKNNYLLRRTPLEERERLYEDANGNPLLMRWIVGQLGRDGSNCTTIAQACSFLENAPEGNDPLEYIFGDLLGTFSASELAVLASLSHFSLPAKVKWISEVSQIAEPAVLTALEDLADRALLLPNVEGESFLLPSLTAKFLHRTRPQLFAETRERLVARVYALAVENGFDPDRFYLLEEEWSAISSSLSHFPPHEDALFQAICDALNGFLFSSGRWDYRLALSAEAEKRALRAEDYHNAGWRAYQQAWIYFQRNQISECLAASDRCQEYFASLETIPFPLKNVIAHLQYLLLKNEERYSEASDVLNLLLADLPAIYAPLKPAILQDLADVEIKQGNNAEAMAAYEEALDLAESFGDKEAIARSKNSLGRLEYAQGNWSAAMKLMTDALVCAEELGRKDFIATCCRDLALCAFELDEKDSALYFIDRALEIFAQLQMQPDLRASQALRDRFQESFS